MDQVTLAGTQLETEAGAGSGQLDTEGTWCCEAGGKECGRLEEPGLHPARRAAYSGWLSARELCPTSCRCQTLAFREHRKPCINVSYPHGHGHVKDPRVSYR